ncbi:MAG: hypothetical protein IJY46_01235 [Lentisphaeria bacterium]|nr:hypothetical protein [Lentisphaeria bacterium]
MYEMKKELAFTQCGADGRLKLHEAVALMMDCCQFQEHQETGLKKYLQNNGIAIFLSSLQIDVLRWPLFRENISTAVKIYGCKSIYGLRRMTMCDESGNLCLLANASGAFFDLNALKAVKVAPEDFNVKFDDAEPMECLPRKIPVPQTSGTETSPLEVKRSHLDPNGHLSSPYYFSIAADILPEEFSWNRVRIEYKQQAKAGEVIIPVLHIIADDKIVVNMRSLTGTSYAVAEFSCRAFC